MPSKKHWQGGEVAIACRAYVAATGDPVKGADQTVETFNNAILKRIEELAPNQIDAGTYHQRGDRVFPYLRDNVFPDVQKFNKARRLVELSCPSGVTEQQKVNMAVAIHLKESTMMDYKYKDFDPYLWRFYSAWLQLRKLPKFAFGSDNASVVPREICENNREMIEIDDESPTDSSTSAIHKKQRGGGRGRTAAKRQKFAQKMKEEENEMKKTFFKERQQNFVNLVDSVELIRQTITQKNQMSILSKALAVTTDPELQKELQEKMIKVTREI